jgi:hypothetical protein
MPFRIAHGIVGRIAASGNRPGMAELDAISPEMACFPASQRGFSSGFLYILLRLHKLLSGQLS